MEVGARRVGVLKPPHIIYIGTPCSFGASVKGPSLPRLLLPRPLRSSHHVLESGRAVEWLARLLGPKVTASMPCLT